MPRYRKLHTKTLESLDINDMPDDFTRLLWVLLPLVLCREGRGIDSAHWLKSKLFPLREDVTPGQVGEALNWYMQRGMVVPYTVDGRDYFYLPSFHKYQGNTTKEAESDYPPPPELVQTSSRVSPEEVESKSTTEADAICNMQYSDSDAEAVSDAAVVALRSVGMGQIDTVLAETGLTTQQIIDTCAWAVENDKSAALVRSLLRQNEAHQPRAPDNGPDPLLCRTCYQHPCECEESA